MVDLVLQLRLPEETRMRFSKGQRLRSDAGGFACDRVGDQSFRAAWQLRHRHRQSTVLLSFSTHRMRHEKMTLEWLPWKTPNRTSYADMTHATCDTCRVCHVRKRDKLSWIMISAIALPLTPTIGIVLYRRTTNTDIIYLREFRRKKKQFDESGLRSCTNRSNG